MGDTLTLKELNRATLARQMLLAREKATPLSALERLMALQAQLARPPYIGLWSRLQGFQAEALTKLARDRKVVRATLMRVTLHLCSARDYSAWRPVLQPMLSAGMQAVLKERARGLDLEGVTRTARACLAGRPLTFDELRPLLKKAWPNADERVLGYAVRTHLPLVQVPSDDTRWGWPGSAPFAPAEKWIGARLGAGAGLEAFVLRYLAALGPATVADAQDWSGMSGLAATFAGLRPKLRVLRDERGRQLFDLPQAPRPPAATPAPVRFLPDFDNILLGHADRARVVRDEHRQRLLTKNLQVPAVFLVDGMISGTWKIERARAVAALALNAFEPLPKKARAELAEEGKALLAFAEPDAARLEVKFS